MAAGDTSIRIASGIEAEGSDSLDVTSLSPSSAPAGSHSLPSPVLNPSISPEDKTVISKRSPLPTTAGHAANHPHALGAALVGRRLEHYELNEFVGGGGMGAVFRATDMRLG